ncbi:diacylglycerol O-acyltransferase [Halospina denitrificans]|uniref:diacylglycerol O-acyltransferase n=1 Tax=Halospina denitrificans TaxID=332522 RepID=A0A4R7JXE7_9GAMM|nr:wax ester/triacylglycerol synthase family O-acyltransferase [Halospina denitrificans]TDT43150.1 diacylglycerol O-acyltransferase [Halospina denitrificans]
MKRMSVLDSSWLKVESEDTPMHVGNLQIFTLPDDAPETFLRDMVERMKGTGDIQAPWKYKLFSGSKLGRSLAPAWVEDKDLDLDYHVRHSALPRPGSERELGILVSRLHSHPLDFSRPLWECHIIEGLEGNRFALYTKMHHSLIDGISGVRLMQKILTTDPTKTNMRPPWTVEPSQRRSQSGQGVTSVQGAFEQALEALKIQAGSTPQLVTALARIASAGVRKDSKLTAPFVGPQSILNNRITGQRRFATQHYQIDRLKAICAVTDASLNDVVLQICGTAMRRFLLEQDKLPEEPLTAGIPVNVRPADDEGTGTAISFMIASLATDEPDPVARLEQIKDSTRVAKEHLQSLPRQVLNQYTMMLMSPYILQLISGLGGRMRPVFNVTISNVPGPPEPLYYEGARMEAMYPVSLVTHGGALNITCLSYAGALNFGYTGCRDTLPSMQRLAVYTGEALEELEQRLL